MKSPIAIFIYKVLGIYLLWYIAYDLWLLPDGRLDEWLSENIVAVSAGLLQGFGYEVYWSGRIIGIGESAGVYLVDGCSGISAIGLFLGFLIAYPGNRLARLLFALTGIGIIYLANIARIVTLSITQANSPELFRFTHDYSTTALFYLVIFGLWMVWAKKGSGIKD